MSDFQVIEKPSYEELVAAIFRKTEEIERLRAALKPFAAHAHCTDQISKYNLALWCAQAMNVTYGQSLPKE